MAQASVSQIDIENLSLIRTNVSNFLSKMAVSWGEKPGRLLDIAPQVHAGAKAHFRSNIIIETLDIDPEAGTDYCADLCMTNSHIAGEQFDIIVCTEVLEHTLNPFAAVGEIWRLLKPSGLLMASSPFNLRIHGPLPDCWRFTEHGWHALLQNFRSVEVKALEDPERFLMPIHYTVVAKK